FRTEGGGPTPRRGASATPGTGMPPGPPLQQEFNDVPHTRGIVSMARGADLNSAGSQFFIVHAEHARHLDGKYTVFGRVEEGLEVLDEIASVDCDFGALGERSAPRERIAIQRLELRPRQRRSAAGGAEGPAGTTSLCSPCRTCSSNATAISRSSPSTGRRSSTRSTT